MTTSELPLPGDPRTVSTRDAQGDAVCTAQVTQDITALRQAQEGRDGAALHLGPSSRPAQVRLAEIESLYRDAPVGLCVFDARLRYLRINRRLAALHGLPVEQHLGKTIREVLPQIADQVEPLMGSLLQTGQPQRDVKVSVTLPSQPGVVRDLVEQWLPMVNAKGRVVGINVVVEEITEFKRAEEQARRSAEELREINETLEQRVNERTAQLRALAARLVQAEAEERHRLAQVLHDGLQQTLVAAALQLSVAQRHKAGDSQPWVREATRLIEEAIESSRSLTTELSPAVLHDGGLAPGLEWLARRMQERYGLNVTLKIADDATLRDIPEDLNVVFFSCASELLFNVHKHAGVKEAQVELALVAPDRLRLTVADQGSGFEMTQTTRDSTSGSGFGLLSIEERILYVGGDYHIESAPGRGTRVTLSLPLLLESGTALEADATSEQPGEAASDSEARKVRLLLVDDHIIIRQGLASLLKGQPGFEIVGEGADGLEAIDKVREAQPDVVLMDVSMPRMDGIEATRRIVCEFPGVSVIGLSMFEDRQKERLIRQAGAVAYVAKGARPELLISMIQACCSRD